MKKIIILSVFLVFLQSCYSMSGRQASSPELQGDTASGQTEALQIFALGDSLTAGYGLPIEDSYPSQLQELLVNSGYIVQVFNAGVSGNTSSELKGRLDWAITDAVAGDIAILVIGANDGLRGMSLEDLENNLQEMIDELSERGMRIVLGGMQIPPNLGIRYTRDFQALYANIAQNNPDIYLIDFFLEGVAGVRSLNLPDGIHPTRAGYEIITQSVYDFLLDNRLVGSQ